MLCQYCRDVDYDQLTTSSGYKIHSDWEALRLSAAQGCDLCSLAVEESHWRDEPRWKEIEQTEQVYCKLSNGSVYWYCGERGRNQRSGIAVCVDGR